MIITDSTTTDGVLRRHLTDGDLTGALWTPAPGSAVTDDLRSTALVLIVHGGGQHIDHPAVISRAQRYVTGCGFAVAALNAPGHGGRTRTPADEQFGTELRRRMAAGEPVAPYVADFNGELASRAVPEWQTLLDALPQWLGPLEPVGLWGVSLGGAIGLSLLAVEPRITAAVLGLIGGPGYERLALGITVPLQFWVQWDDELIPRGDALALFDAFGSTQQIAVEKTLHANPGRHIELPRFEQESAEVFFVRHLH